MSSLKKPYFLGAKWSSMQSGFISRAGSLIPFNIALNVSFGGENSRSLSHTMKKLQSVRNIDGRSQKNG